MTLPTKPTSASIELAETMLGSVNPFLEYPALIIGQVMQLNYQGMTEILNDCRSEFEALGADDLLNKIEVKVDNLFLPYINEGQE